MKSNNSKYLIIGGVTILGGLGAYYWIKKRKASKAALMENQSISQNTSVSNVIANSGFPLQSGSRGENVKRVQAFLNQKLNAGLVVDGIFGPNTLKALKALNGNSSVSESEFKQYIGTPIQTPSILSINPVTAPIAAIWNLFAKK